MSLYQARKKQKQKKQQKKNAALSRTSFYPDLDDQGLHVGL